MSNEKFISCWSMERSRFPASCFLSDRDKRGTAGPLKTSQSFRSLCCSWSRSCSISDKRCRHMRKSLSACDALASASVSLLARVSLVVRAKLRDVSSADNLSSLYVRMSSASFLLLRTFSLRMNSFRSVSVSLFHSP